MRVFRKEYRRAHNKAFTLVEMLIVISIMAIITAIAVPGFISWLPDYRLKAATRDMFSNFQKAKMLAVKSMDNIAVTFTHDANGDSTGYVMYVDSDKDFTPTDQDGNQEADIITTVLWDRDYKNSVSQVSNNFAENENDAPTIAFRGNGLPADSQGAGNGTVRLKNSNGKERKVIVSRTGNLRIEMI